jgi:hypothetical protein
VREHASFAAARQCARGWSGRVASATLAGGKARLDGRIPLRRAVIAFTVATAGMAATAAAAQAATLAIGPARPCQLSGQKVNMLGGGYTPSSYVDFTIDGKSLGSLPTDPSGSLAGQITLGSLKGVKSHALVATDQANPALTASTSFMGTTRQVTVKPKHARAGKKLKLKGYGFLNGGKVYMHVRRGGYAADAKVGKPKGVCGTWSGKRHVVPSSAASGVYHVQFDQKKRYSKKTQPRVRGTMTVTRTLSSTAFGGAKPLYDWTQVD